MKDVNNVIKRATEIAKQRKRETKQASTTQQKYTLSEALEVFVKGAQLAIAEKEAKRQAEESGATEEEQAVIYARDLLKAAAELNS